MPKVVIREFDGTTAGFAPSNSFSVAIPGFVASDKLTNFAAVCDANKVYQCSSVSDFNANIGQCETVSVNLEAKAPTLSLLRTVEDPTTHENVKVYYGTLSGLEFYYTYADQVYTRAEQVGDPVTGRLKGPVTVSGTTTYYEYTKATTYDATTNYSVILVGSEGNDATDTPTAQTHLGNQIAYILLNLGYTIYYKQITSIADLIDSATYECFKDRSIYDIRYIMHGMIDNITVNSVEYKVSDANTAIYSAVNADNSKVDTGRGDCIALQDIAKSNYTGKTLAEALTAMQADTGTSGSYGALFAPSIVYSGVSSSAYNNSELPGSFHYLACAATAFNRYSEWYAVSGYTRGICGMSIVQPSYIFGDTAVQKVQQRAGSNKSINLIIKLGNSYYLWGNRTGLAAGSGLTAQNFLNIRQLCCTLKKAIYTTCRQLMFDPNSDVLWTNFCGALRPTLENMKNNQGIRDYQFVKLETSLKAKLFATVRIIPIEAVEDFEIAVYMEDNFDNTNITLTEILTNVETI